MRRIILGLIIAIVAMTGTAAAYNAALYDAVGVSPAPNPLIIQPGQSITLSYHMTNILPGDVNQSFAYSHTVTVKGGTGAAASDLTVTTPASVTPTSQTYTDVGAITIVNGASSPMDGKYYVEITAGGGTVETAVASRTIEVPEFPTIALPIAAILGLAFFFQRRREE
ncbi:MAG: PEF-CTERM sorting domain-containing protein [Euryarchaeota archaeon]|nr:PEF-CTERM sorting domain-containing protein [Euryarchaeota archaeon]